MAEISSYGKDRMRPYEKRIGQMLVDKVNESDLSQYELDEYHSFTDLEEAKKAATFHGSDEPWVVVKDIGFVE